MNSTRPPQSLGLWHPVTLIATWFGAGLAPIAPGTWGSIAALLLAWPIAVYGGGWALLAASLSIFCLGVWASGAYARATNSKDPGQIVVDEVAGQWLALVAVPVEPIAYLAAFALFRLCDIVKPWPANWADRRLSGGMGVMLDDMIAGAYALLVVHIVLYAMAHI